MTTLGLIIAASRLNSGPLMQLFADHSMIGVALIEGNTTMYYCDCLGAIWKQRIFALSLSSHDENAACTDKTRQMGRQWAVIAMRIAGKGFCVCCGQMPHYYWDSLWERSRLDSRGKLSMTVGEEKRFLTSRNHVGKSLHSSRLCAQEGKKMGCRTCTLEACSARRRRAAENECGGLVGSNLGGLWSFGEGSRAAQSSGYGTSTH
jgi:hypothetical protein